MKKLKKEVYKSNRSHDNFAFKWERKCFDLSKKGYGNTDYSLNCAIKASYHKEVSRAQRNNNRLLSKAEKQDCYKILDDYYKGKYFI